MIGYAPNSPDYAGYAMPKQNPGERGRMILGILQGKIFYSCKLGTVQFIPRTWH
jgi:hypothetical protein